MENKPVFGGPTLLADPYQCGQDVLHQQISSLAQDMSVGADEQAADGVHTHEQQSVDPPPDSSSDPVAAAAEETSSRLVSVPHARGRMTEHTAAMQRIEAHAESIALGKRPLSPSSCTHDQLTKCLRAPNLRPSEEHDGTPCLHCRSPFHTWSGCNAYCLRCLGRHPGRRCPKIELSMYTPGGFVRAGEILSGTIHRTPMQPMTGPAASSSADWWESMALVAQPAAMSSSGALEAINAQVEPICAPVRAQPTSASSAPPERMDKINPERAAMISSTPSGSSDRPILVPGGGQSLKGMNLMPLGRPNRLTGQVELPPVALLRPPVPKQHTAKIWTEAEEQTWNRVVSQIQTAVVSARDASKTANNGNDRDAIDKRLSSALNLLKPAFLRATRVRVRVPTKRGTRGKKKD